MFGRGRTFDRIDLAVKEGITLAECQRELSSMLGPGFQVQPPASRGAQFEALLRGYSAMVGLSSGFALFIGMFIIYNAFAVAVTQRRAEIGMLRALGATQGQVLRMFVGESAVLGAAGSVLGIAAGLAIARLLVSSVSGLVGSVYGVAQRATELAITPLSLVEALGVGVLTSVAAALLPARAAAAVDPLQALRRGAYHVFSTRELRARVAAAMGCGLLAAASFADAAPPAAFYLGYAAAMLGAVLLVPTLSVYIARALRPGLVWWRPVEGALAADSLIQAPRRTAATVAALMLSLALVLAFDGMARASYGSIVEWMDTTLNPDLFVTPTESLDNQTIRFPSSMAAELRQIDGVADVQMIRNSRIAFRDGFVTLVAIEVESIARSARPPAVMGDEARMYERAAAGDGLIVSDNLARLQGIAVGDVLDVMSPSGVLRLPVVGTVIDYSDQQGAIIIDRAVYLRHWRDDTVNLFRVYVRDRQQASGVRDSILGAYAGKRQVFVLTNGALRDYIQRLASQWFGLTYVQVIIAVLVAILGVVNTLTVSIADRRREFAVLQAVGALSQQLKRAVRLEAIAVAAVGLCLGVALGAVNLAYVLEIVQRDMTGMRLAYRFPLATAVVLVPVIAAAAFVAALWPSRSAGRDSLVAALEYE
jgi:putative ABC transport system permease protein